MKRLLHLIAALLAWAASPACAHLTPNSEIRLAFGRDRIETTLLIPLGELKFAEPAFEDLRAGALTGNQRHRLTGFLDKHMEATALDGRRWEMTLSGAKVVHRPLDLEVRLVLMPPAGASIRKFQLRYDAVINRIPNHIALISVEHDFAAGHVDDQPALLAGLRSGNIVAKIDRGTGSAWRGFLAAIRLGMQHIAEGYDHLLFLIVLLLPSPLIVTGKRWGGYAGWRTTFRSLAIVVTAFTIGHSLTLAGGAIFGWKLPPQPVEVLIAASILISALHAWRPLFAGREALIAGGFGLVHGLAFATVIGRIGLDRSQKALAIFGFNLGIELVQLLIVAILLPGLIVLARSAHYHRFRYLASIIAAAAACWWIIERLGALTS